MFSKKITFFSICSLLLFLVTCNNPNDPEKEEPGPTVEAVEVYGAIQINLNENDKTASFLATCKNGQTPQSRYDTVMTEGTMYLHATTYPLCEGCGFGNKCVADDVCLPDPKKISVGTITIAGAEDTSGISPFSVDEIGKYYQEAMKYPPFNEGDMVTVTVAGKDTVPSFTLQTTAVAPLVLLNDVPILCEDGKDIELKWTPPGKEINSKIQILIDVSYHGGSKAQIIGECDDDGSQIITGAMLDKLKSYGIAGFPRVDMKRITKGTGSETHVKFTIESSISAYLDIPGVVSCNNIGEACPSGGICSKNRRCE